MSSIQDLIAAAQQNPPKPVLDGLLNESEIVGLHGPPEAFKTMFCLQLTDSLATREPFLGVWQVPKNLQVYFLETEMNVPALGARLARIFAHRKPPTGVHMANTDQLRAFRKAGGLVEKFALVKEWVQEAGAELVVLDTCNPFFRGKESPNDETTAGKFFDLVEALGVKNVVFVRHNHKRKLEDNDQDAAAKIRGSGQFGDVPDLLLELRRADKRTNEVVLSITKFRNGTKPDDLNLWFDSREFRLISIPPVVHLLLTGAKSREELIKELEERFNVSERSADDQIADERPYLSQRMDGHRKVFEIDWKTSVTAPWRPKLISPTDCELEGQFCKVA
jgi:hypothetical protein